MADIVCVGAHPDDVEIGMGGVAATMARRGADVLIVDLTDGEPTPFGTHERRMVEAAAAASTLGCRRITLGLTNRRLADGPEARQALAEVLRAERPGIVFAPYPEDAHPDHEAAARIAEAARFYAKLTKSAMAGEPHYPARLYRYMAVHLRLLREPSFLVDVSDTLPLKLEALRRYESQFSDNPANASLLEHVERTARHWGDIARVFAAEPFFSAEPPVVASVSDLV
ncbi:bacillithiol biosynthesis deacetylase BshB1 [Anaerosoma tenue]|uniref:bacillithiol biosynthesis deacetylase BshB1 n=1 Tax=Anaerosoma tenue TaxID=2933588 RepID=UPI002260C9C4|nr:bacillithiol biosynthesis deacetylase BshB1 [Anaerosoma tenue]MCK8114002.1 bacillithiol biosynthesis deacetylase BshB1 [Anaerosoma tenue]